VSCLSCSALIPPNLFILLAMIGVVIARRRKPFGLAVATGAIGCLYLAAMPVTADYLTMGHGASAVVLPGRRLPGGPITDRRGYAPVAVGGGFPPQIPALLKSYYVFHELIGLAWYRVRYGH
jgi:hypothetical protein